MPTPPREKNTINNIINLLTAMTAIAGVYISYLNLQLLQQWREEDKISTSLSTIDSWQPLTTQAKKISANGAITSTMYQESGKEEFQTLKLSGDDGPIFNVDSLDRLIIYIQNDSEGEIKNPSVILTNNCKYLLPAKVERGLFETSNIPNDSENILLLPPEQQEISSDMKILKINPYSDKTEIYLSDTIKKKETKEYQIYVSCSDGGNSLTDYKNLNSQLDITFADEAALRWKREWAELEGSYTTVLVSDPVQYIESQLPQN